MNDQTHAIQYQQIATPEVEQRVFILKKLSSLPWARKRFHGPPTSSISMNLNIAWKSTNVKSMTTLSQSQMTIGILFLGSGDDRLSVGSFYDYGSEMGIKNQL